MHEIIYINASKILNEPSNREYCLLCHFSKVNFVSWDTFLLACTNFCIKISLVLELYMATFMILSALYHIYITEHYSIESLNCEISI